MKEREFGQKVITQAPRGMGHMRVRRFISSCFWSLCDENGKIQEQKNLLEEGENVMRKDLKEFMDKLESFESLVKDGASIRFLDRYGVVDLNPRAFLDRCNFIRERFIELDELDKKKPVENEASDLEVINSNALKEFIPPEIMEICSMADAIKERNQIEIEKLELKKKRFESSIKTDESVIEANERMAKSCEEAAQTQREMANKKSEMDELINTLSTDLLKMHKKFLKLVKILHEESLISKGELKEFMDE